MKDFISDFIYMCSAQNTKSRATYLMIAGIMVALLVITVIAIITLVTKGANPLSIISMIVAPLLLIAIIIWLWKS